MLLRKASERAGAEKLHIVGMSKQSQGHGAAMSASKMQVEDCVTVRPEIVSPISTGPRPGRSRVARRGRPSVELARV